MPFASRALISKVVGRGSAHTLFFDRNMGRRVPEALRLVDIPVEVVYHDRMFGQDTKDDQWLPVVGAKGWSVIGQDRRFHRRSTERLAIVQYKVGVFYLWGAGAPAWEKLRCFMRAYDDILDVLCNVDRPFLYRIERSGRLADISERLRRPLA